jgi:cytochrome c-type biogenesis protein CcmH
MMPLLFSALLVTLLVLGILAIPLLHRGRALRDNRKALNVAVYRDQLQELEKELQLGTLSAEDYAQSREEIERRLLEDVEGGDSKVESGSKFGWKGWLVLALIPLMAAGFYVWRGHPGGEPAQNAEAPNMEQINAMVQGLAEKLAKNPDNPEGWVMLARSYMNLNRVQDAVAAFAHLEGKMDNDSGLLADYAEALVATQDPANATKAAHLVEQALALEPGNVKALFLSGGLAFSHGDYRKAVTSWEKIMPLLEPGSEDANFVLDGINKARAKGGLPPRKASDFQPAGSGAPVKNGQVDNAAPGAATIQGEVELDSVLKDKASPKDTVFILARAVEGPRMPLAVVRTTVAQLPYRFELTDAMAMTPTMKLSGFPLVRLEVRVSKSGEATPHSGDLLGASLPLKPGARGVTLKISSVQP